MLKTPRIGVRALVGLLLLALAACKATAPSPPAEAPVAVEASETPAQPAAAPSDTPQPAQEDTPAAPPTNTPLAAQATPTLRPELEATDPTTVNLAAGKPTLLEFFAFW